MNSSNYQPIKNKTIYSKYCVSTQLRIYLQYFITIRKRGKSGKQTSAIQKEAVVTNSAYQEAIIQKLLQLLSLHQPIFSAFQDVKLMNMLRQDQLIVLNDSIFFTSLRNVDLDDQNKSRKARFFVTKFKVIVTRQKSKLLLFSADKCSESSQKIFVESNYSILIFQFNFWFSTLVSDRLKSYQFVLTKYESHLQSLKEILTADKCSESSQKIFSSPAHPVLFLLSIYLFAMCCWPFLYLQFDQHLALIPQI